MKRDCWKLNHKKKSEHSFSSYEEEQCEWILDSSASSHMTFDKNDFSQLRPIQSHINISIATGGKLEAIGIGIIHLTLTNGENIRIEDALYVPKLDKRLLSVSAMNKKDIQLTFGKSKCEISSKRSNSVTIERS